MQLYTVSIHNLLTVCPLTLQTLTILFCHLLQKAASQGNENTGGGGSMGAMKSSRRRWGQTVAKTAESWEELDSSEPAASNSKKPSLGNAEEQRSPREHHSQ